ncbi:type III pantothenate kinase [Rhabdothermincola sediminis]|uniref:type III pantothenate kinase n=1 Tax=Rhabdothermincola sediminis TaxID=2751370 RepID=UPI001AA049DF|nr:type III pantothenate kinase [Rhabdothermincola sediminis]
MLLAIDAGNTQTVVGLYELDDAGSAAGRRPEDGLLDHWRIASLADRTSDEMAVLLQGFLAFRGHALDDIDGVVISSGVPRITATLRDLADGYLDFDPVVIEPGVRTGIAIQYENPKEVGADRIANAVGAYDLYGGPTIIADFGTATTCDAVSENGEYLGGAIAPGIEISMDALVGRAAALRAVELREPRHVLGKSTVESIQSGAVYGFAAQVDGLCDRIQEELGDCTIVSTGGLADLITPLSRRIQHVEPWLTLHGLRLVYEKNA